MYLSSAAPAVWLSTRIAAPRYYTTALQWNALQTTQLPSAIYIYLANRPYMYTSDVHNYTAVLHEDATQNPASTNTANPVD